jgi:asparagine synthase (glutamine-hydrolysing)
MSGIAGVFDVDRRPVGEALIRRMLARMPARGREHVGVRAEDGAGLGTVRHEWELAEDFSGEVQTLDDGDVVVAADASLYYRRDLERKLVARNVCLDGHSASHFILAAFRVWGDRCVEHLEGDYAFIVYERRSGRVFCARDFSGQRPLYYADLGYGLVLGSTISAVLAHPACPDTLNVPFLAEAASLLWPSAGETAYEAIALVPAGSSLSWTRGGRASLRAEWVPPGVESAHVTPFDEATRELQDLLCRAVDERLAKRGTTAVWMSGGWDSTAVFGAGQQVLRGRDGRQELRPVSISYPPGDPGCEDELITAAADWWGKPVHWLHSRDIPVIEQPVERAITRDEPAAHPYEHWNRALAGGSRHIGARVAFHGVGGDQLFQVSPVFLADLLRTGRWITFAREWRALRLRGWGDAWRWALKPTVTPGLLDAATRLRGGRRVHGTYERWIPDWINGRLVTSLRERQRRHVRPRRGGRCSAYETVFYLTTAHFPRIVGTVAGLALEEGVEVRAPLYDARVVRFAARRPRWERCSDGETKRLLRAAMRRLLPDQLLAARPFRTGVTSRYFSEGTRSALPDLAAHLEDPWASAEVGILDRARLARASSAYRTNPDPNVGVALLCTLQVELWLRARARAEAGHAVDADAAFAASRVLAALG